MATVNHCEVSGFTGDVVKAEETKVECALDADLLTGRSLKEPDVFAGLAGVGQAFQQTVVHLNERPHVTKVVVTNNFLVMKGSFSNTQSSCRVTDTDGVVWTALGKVVHS